MEKFYLRSFNLLLSLLIIGASSHCIREDILASLGSSVMGCAPFEQAHHDGESEGHHQKSHQHLFTGITAGATSVKAQFDLFHNYVLLVPLAVSGLSSEQSSAAPWIVTSCLDGFSFLRRAVYTLLSAALAPPLAV